MQLHAYFGKPMHHIYFLHVLFLQTSHTFILHNKARKQPQLIECVSIPTPFQDSLISDCNVSYTDLSKYMERLQHRWFSSFDFFMLRVIWTKHF